MRQLTYLQAICEAQREEMVRDERVILLGEIGDIFYDISTDEAVRAVVLTGAGDVFCSGGNPEDLVLARPTDFNYDWMQKMRRLVSSLLDIDQPVIAALNGDAVGVGATIALYCDIIIAAEGASIYDPHVTKEGIAAGDGGHRRRRRRVPDVGPAARHPSRQVPPDDRCTAQRR